MEKAKKIIIALIIILALGNAYFVAQCLIFRAQLKEANKIIKVQQVNEKIVAFTQLFIDKVLSGQTEVSFEDRLQLENAVRGLNDQEIFNQWQKFVKGGTQEGQQNVSKLLKLLITKISY